MIGMTDDIFNSYYGDGMYGKMREFGFDAADFQGFMQDSREYYAIPSRSLNVRSRVRRSSRTMPGS